MSSLALPDLGAAPGVCRDLARSAQHVTRVDRALACVCAAVPPLPTLLDQPLLGPILCDHPPAVPRHTDVRSDRAVRARPAPAAPAQRIGPSRRVEAPEAASCPVPVEAPEAGSCPVPRDSTPVPRETAAGACAPAPRRVRRGPAECPPEPPAARAVRGDPTCRVGTAQLRALARDLPARTGQRSSRPLPPAGSGTGAAVVPAAEKLSGPAAAVTRRLGIDIRPALARTPRPGPPAPSGLLDRHALTRGRAAERSAAGEGRADRRPVAGASPRAAGPHAEHDPHDPRGAPGPPAALEEPDRRWLSRREGPDGRGADAGHPRGGRHTAAARTDRRPDGEPHTPSYRQAARAGAAEAVESGADGPPGTRLLPDDRKTPEGRANGVRHDPLEGAKRWRTGSHRRDERWPEARPDDEAIEAAMQRVLTDAARRYGIEV